MRSSALSRLKRKEKKNRAVIRRANAALLSSLPDERWLFENRLQILKLTETAISTLSEVGELPPDGGEARVMKLCRSIVEDCVFSLTEEDVISRINDYQRENSYLTVGELLFLRIYFHFVAVDIVADGIREGTLFRVCDAIRLIFAIRDIDFERIYETVSYSESVLIRDPAGVYVMCDGATKSMYRKKLSEISRRFHMGEYETSKFILKNAEESEGRARHVGWHIMKYSRHAAASHLYFPILYILPAIIVLALAALSYPTGRMTLLLSSLLLYLPLRGSVRAICDDIISRRVTPDILPRLSLDEIPSEGKTLVVYTVSLSGGASDRATFDRVATYALAYRTENLGFAVLADLPDSDTEMTERDGEIIAEAERRIDEINGVGGDAYLFYRQRTFSETERRFIGPERKRGAQAELFSLLSGKESALTVYGGEPSGYKYVLALDADTEILFSDVKKLIATALHPCCLPAISRGSGYPIVTDGYGVIAPEAKVSLRDADGRRRYTAYRYAYGGRSEYERASFSVYSYLFGIGSFCGKGLISVDAYMKTVYGAFPRERILSHDTAEGVRLRCGFASDLRVYDGVPRDYLRERSRSHRWIRGDVQALCLLGRGVRSAMGEKYKNPVGLTGRLIMFEPVARAVASAISPLVIILSLIGGLPLGAVVMLLSVSGEIWHVSSLLIGSYRVPWRRYFSGLPNYYRTAAFETYFAFSSIADTASYSGDAIYRAFYRMRLSKRRLLEWKTAAASDSDASGGTWRYVSIMWFSELLGVASIFAVLIPGGLWRFALPLFGTLWLTFPFVMKGLNSAASCTPMIETAKREDVTRDVALMWRFFSDNVTARYNYLPPDNVTLLPEEKTAERTSPTNIGLYLLSAVNAHDFGFIGMDELHRRLLETLKTVSRLEKWNGHLYNWYDIKTLSVLYPAYVSTVDSGNLIACLLTVKNAVSDMNGFTDIVEAVSGLIDSADFSVLYNKRRNLFHIGYNSALGELDKNVYDLYPSEMLTTSFFAVAKGQVPAEHITALGRVFVDEGGRETMLSWSGSTFEYFMPLIFLPSMPGTARYEALAAAERCQREDNALLEGSVIYGRSESSFYDFDDSMSYSYKAHGCDALALSPDTKSERVIAPYALYLMSQFAPSAADVLVAHRGGELFGKYGFYESADMTKTRVGDSCGIVRQYMSHHVGMSIVSAANLCFSGINARRFCATPCVAASLPLLYESVSLNRRRSEEKYTLIAETRIPTTWQLSGESIISDSAVVSNGREKIVADKNGRIAVYDGQTLLTQPICRGCSDFFVLLRTGGEIFSCTSGPRVQFSTDGTAISYVNEFIGGGGIIRSELVMTVEPTSPTAIFELSVSGLAGHADVLIMFSPVMNTRAAYESAPSYSDIFITSRQESDSAVRFSKKVSPGVRRELLASVSCGEYDTLTLHTKKDAILPFRYTPGDVAAVFDAKKTNTNGACVHPVFTAVIGSENDSGVVRCALTLGAAEARFSAIEARVSLEKQLRANTALAGADTAAVKCAMELVGDICGSDSRVVRCAEDMTLPEGRGALWRFGISGDLPIVTVFCCELSSPADVFAVSELIAAKRFLFVSGIRFDLVFVAPAAGYMNTGKSKLCSLIRSGSSERLLGKNNGIFIVDREVLLPNDELYFTVMSCRVFNIGTEHTFTITKPSGVKIKPMAEPTARGAIGFEYKDGGRTFKIMNGKNVSPYSMVYANTIFGTLLNNASCGYTWYANSALCRISRRHVDPMLSEPGEVLCLSVNDRSYDLAREAETVIFGRDCARYSGAVGGVEYELCVGVSAKLPAKLYHLAVKNVQELSRELSDSLRAQFIFYPSSPSLFSEGRLRLTSESSSEVAVFGVSDEIYDTVVVDGDSLRVQCALLSGQCGFVAAAAPGKTECLRYIRDKFRRAELIPAAYEDYERHVDSILVREAYRGDAAFLSGIVDSASYQAVFFRMLSRSGHDQSGGAYGFRDQLQDSLAALFFRPELTKLQILRSCARQYEDGRGQHWWHPYPFGGGLRTRCSDDYMWLVLVTAEYVLSTGDTEILSKRAAYLVSEPLGAGERDRYEHADKGETKATVLEHCIAAISASYKRGTHGLPLMGTGDWNDGMDEVGAKGSGESVWLAFFFAVVYRKFSEMLRALNIDPILSERLMYEADTLVSSVELTSWDGEWYIRAFDDDGAPLGSADSAEGRIDLLPQAFSVFAEADPERSKKALESVISHLFDGRTGILRLFAPSYEVTERHGYICRYPAGIRENGGQYTHAAVWLAAAAFASGDRETGELLLSALSPYRIYKDGGMSGRFTSEPYLLAADIYYGEGITGHSGWSGYTGSAAWYYMTVMRYYLGVSLSFGDVVITPPCVMSYTASVRSHGCEVTVTVSPDEPSGSDEDEVYTVRAGESVAVKPKGEKLKIYVKVEN